MGTSKTMMVAQQLYEGMEVGEEGSVGLITYMRTDSFNISKEAQAEALAFIRDTIGPDYSPETPNAYRSKKDSQGAHEAVRPSSVHRTPDNMRKYLDHDQYRLYKLIWERFVASQMTPAEMKVTSVDIDARREAKFFLLRATATEVVFAGTGEKFPLPLNQDVRIPIATTNAETLRYACGMDMYHAAVVVK